MSLEKLFSSHIVNGSHQQSNYFQLIREILEFKANSNNPAECSGALNRVYKLIQDEILTTRGASGKDVSFGTSGWRGFLGKEINVHTVSCVTEAIVDVYKDVGANSELTELLEVNSFKEVQNRGCVIGFDNRFGGETIAAAAVKVLVENGINVHYAGESTTGVLSAAVLELGAAFSVNLTPSHNPLEYGGYKFNAADAGPAATTITKLISEKSNKFLKSEKDYQFVPISDLLKKDQVSEIDSLGLWKNFVRNNSEIHKLNLDDIEKTFLDHKDNIHVVIDSVHGASRLHMKSLFGEEVGKNFHTVRDTIDYTFGGVAPEPSSKNMAQVTKLLNKQNISFKLGAIIDPDGDRIRFTDGTTEISMNQFGAMAYHFLHQRKGVKGLVAKTVATSNLANQLAKTLGEEVFEPPVGFKEFKPVIGKAVVLFEESDGISVIGHTPEKDAYIGLVLALDMVLTTGKNLGDYLREIEGEFGAYFPEKDSVEVSVKGAELLNMLNQLSEYKEGDAISIGDTSKTIDKIIDIDGYKIVLEDGSWLMIRPSGTEPKVRFYVESRDSAGTASLVETAKELLKKIGVLN